MPDTPNTDPSGFERPAAPSRDFALRTLNTFAIDVMSIRSADDLFWYVAQNVVGRLGFVDCVIYEATEDQSTLVQCAAWGEKNPFGRTIDNPLHIPFGTGVTGQVAADKTAVIVDDLLANQNYIPDTQPARSEICVPILIRDRVVGVIDSEHPDVAAFGEADLEVLSTVAAMTGAKLELLAESERSQQRYVDLVRSHGDLTEEIKNRKALEAELFKSRKLEAIGRLTGGFAHGFNNLLTVISGNLDLIDEAVTQAEAKQCLSDAKDAAERGSKLITDMLAFSQRMRLRSEELDLNDLIRSVCKNDAMDMAPDLVLDLSEPLWPIMADQPATEIALFNLLLNASDAMPEGGTTTIRTENITLIPADPAIKRIDLDPGRYVRVSVTDTGTGIDPMTLQQIFDPFFTTKSRSDVAGLGLSMVQGFMKQSRGAVVTKSELSKGTTFSLYFPALEA